MIWGAALLLPMSYPGLAEAQSPTVSSVTLTMAGAPKPGSTLTFHGHAVDWRGTPEYQFWLENATGWHMVQNYSPNSSWSMTAAKGSYAVTVYAMNASQIKGGYWDTALSATQIANVNSTVSLSTPPTGTQYTSLSLTAQATNLIHPMYQFWVEHPDGVWQGMDYSTKNVDQFNPSARGTYHVIVYAKDPIAPANATNAVWSETETITVAPAAPPVANLATYLDNPLPGFHNPNAVLLGEPATLTAVVTNGTGSPLANVPVVFTATNDSNPSDHVSFGQGLSGSAVTNANGVVTTTVTVTNPEDGANSQLAVDPNALTIVGYSVSVPSDPNLAPVNNVLRFVAVNSPNLAVNGTPTATGESLTGTVSTPLALTSSNSYVVPTPATSAPYTVPVNGNTGSYGPDSTVSLTPVAINTPFLGATLNAASLGLSTGSSLTVDFIPNGSTTPQYTRTFKGPLSLSGFGIQIPAEATPGNITATITAPGQTDVAHATGFNLTSVSVTPNGTMGSELRPITGGSMGWTTVPIQYTAPTPLSRSAAAALMGSLYQGAWTYADQVPVFPQSGDALITATAYGKTQARYAYPSQNNGSDQNVLATSGTPQVLTSDTANPTFANTSTGVNVSSSTSGLGEIQGTLNIAGVNPRLTEQPATMFQEGVLWKASTPTTSSTKQYAWAGQSVAVTATLTTATGNPVANSTAFQWNLSGSGYTVVREGTKTNASGQASLVLNATGVATGTISATAGSGSHISLADSGGSFQAAQVNWLQPTLTFAAPNGRHVTNGETAPTTTPSVGSPQEFGLSLAEISATGQQAPITNDPVTATKSTTSVGQVSHPSLNSNGQINFEATSTQAGAEDITVTTPIPSMIHGEQSVGTGTVPALTVTIPLAWQPGVPFASIVATPSNPAVGTTAHITATLKDVYGNPVSGVPVIFSLQGSSATLSTKSVTTLSNGTATVLLSGGTTGETDVITMTTPTGQRLQQTITWNS